MTEILSKISLFTVYFSGVLAVLYLLKWRANGAAYRWFTLYLVSIAIVQLSLDLSIRLNPGEINLFLFKYYLIAEFITLSFFYRVLLKSKWINWVIVGGLLLLTIQYIYYPQYLEYYNPVGVWMTHIILVIFALFHLYKALSEKMPFTLISAGLVVYLMGSAVVFSAGNVYQDIRVPEYIVEFLNRINSMLYLGLQVLILFEWWTKYYKAKTPSLQQ